MAPTPKKIFDGFSFVPGLAYTREANDVVVGQQRMSMLLPPVEALAEG